MSLTESRMPARGCCSLSLVAWSMAMSLWAGTNAAADPTGRFVFLGRTADQQHLVWLSAISPGQPEVESAACFASTTAGSTGGLHLTLPRGPERGRTKL